MFFMRIAYLQYILFSIIAIIDILAYVRRLKVKQIDKKILGIDIFLWILSITELISLENYFENIKWF